MSEGETTRSGKIGRLPLAIRTDLNTRIRAGNLSPVLLPWLNEMPEVREILKRDFGDVDISPANLSEWRQGGYQDWLERRLQIEEKRELAEYCFELAESGKSLLDGSASILGGKLMEIMEGVNIHDQKELLMMKPDTLIGFMEGLAALQSQANSSHRIKQADHKIKQADRRLDLDERKYESRFLKDFAKYYEDRQVQEIMAGKAKGQVKLDQLALRIFGAKPDLEPINVTNP